ncbi:thioredoxin-like protein [Haematococcus lacustris]
MVIGTPCPPIGGLTFIKGAPFAVPGPPGHGRVLVLEFWATWCGPCVQTVPHLTELQHAYRERGVTVLGISTENNVQKVRQFVDSKGSTMDYTVAVDLGGEATEGLLRAAGARGIPHAFIVDASNTIRYSGHPMDPTFQTALQQAVATAGSASSGVGPKPGGEALPLISASFEELMGMSVKELKGLLAERGISMAGAAEKADLARLVQEQASKVQYYK